MTSERETIDILPNSTDLLRLIAEGDVAAANAFFDLLDASDTVLVMSRLPSESRTALLSIIGAERGAKLIENLPEPQLIEAVEDLTPYDAAKILEEFPSDAQADVIGGLDIDAATAIIEELRTEDARDVARLTSYDDSVAGGLMVTEYLSYEEGKTVADVIADLGHNAETYADYDIQYAYVTDHTGVLSGVLRMRDLLLAPRLRPLQRIMIPSPQSVRDLLPLEELVRFFDQNKFFGAPVVDENGLLVGVLQRSAVEAAVADDLDAMYRSSQGIVGGEELRSMPLLLRSRRRLSWLSINVVLNLIAASIIAFNQDTLEAVIALAVFLPIISDMSGCSGNQAVAVSMRELTLGVIRPTEIARTVLAEAALGVINGLALGLLVGVVALLWKGDMWLGLVVGCALMANTIVAVCIGGAVPLILKRMKVDPALAAGPILTTITDMCGFFIVLTLAKALIDKLA